MDLHRPVRDNAHYPVLVLEQERNPFFFTF